MMIKRKSWAGVIAMLFAAAVTIVACSKKSNTANPDPVVNGFDKTGMLTNYADNLIIPAYTSLQQKIVLLETATNVFLTTPNTANQTALKAVFKDAYLQFEHVSVAQFGPAESVLLNNFLNTFPTEKAVINMNINNGIYNLATNSTIGQQGFPALDYLLFGTDAITRLTGPNAVNAKKYIQDVVARLKTLNAGVLDTWKNTYRATFVANTRSDAASPLALLVNQFAFEMDQLKGPRIGWPFGKQSAGVQYPENVEGYGAGISVALAVENLTSLKAMFNGNGSGKGMSDYLVALNKTQLSTDVLKQFDVALNALKAVPDPLSNALTTNPTQIEAAYKEVQILLTLIKTDVASATGVRITYQDTDGD
jgi:predicted lipoprotein